MADDPQRAMRRDAARNREQLLLAARHAFANYGPDVPLEDVARAAAVSRTTLYRNFATREELVATVFEENVARIEQQAAALCERPDAVVQLFDLVLDMLMANRSITRVLSGVDVALSTGLAARTASALEPLIERGKVAGIVWPDVGVQDVMLAFQMAGGATADRDAPERQQMDTRIRAMLHRSVFAAEPNCTPAPTGQPADRRLRP